MFTAGNIRKKDNELIPAKAADNVTISEKIAQAVGKTYQYLISLMVTAAIINLFKIINIQYDKRTELVVSGLQKCFAYRAFSHTAVIYMGQLIYTGIILQKHFLPFFFINILYGQQPHYMLRKRVTKQIYA